MIKLKSVTKSYSSNNNENIIFSNLDIDFEIGATHCIIGSSGSGKTTLLNLIGGLDTDFKGSITILNKNIHDIKNLEKFRNQFIGFMFQSHNLLSQLSVSDNILLSAQLYSKNYKESKERMSSLLEYVGLYNKKNVFPSYLSGGERQRVAFVRSLVNKPSIVIADEPTGNIDSKNSNVIIDLIKKYNDEFKQTFIIATHDSQVSSSADFLYEINNMDCIKL